MDEVRDVELLEGVGDIRLGEAEEVVADLGHRFVSVLFCRSKHTCQNTCSHIASIFPLWVLVEFTLQAFVAGAQQQPQITQMWVRLGDVGCDVVGSGSSRSGHRRCEAGVRFISGSGDGRTEQDGNIMVAFTAAENTCQVELQHVCKSRRKDKESIVQAVQSRFRS